MNKNSLLVIIAAAGIGERFGKHLPKQYEKINEKKKVEKNRRKITTNE
jgi:2-C-methyl-D-erythritol 4-phosphate cytidylyltransferase